MQFQFLSESHHPEKNWIVGDFVSQGIWGAPGKFGPFCSMPVFSGDKLIAGVIYHNWQEDEGTIEVSCYSSRRQWMTRNVIRTALSMPFTGLGCQTIVARHSEDAGHIRHMWRSFGAKEYVIPRLRGKDAPAEAVAVLTDDAWFASKWMTEKETIDG